MSKSRLAVLATTLLTGCVILSGCPSNNNPSSPNPPGPTNTPTITGTPTATGTTTATATVTSTPTKTATATATATLTKTATATITATPTSTDSPTITPTPTSTCTGGGQAGDTTIVGSAFGVNQFMDAWAVNFGSTVTLRNWEVNINSLPSAYTIGLYADTGSSYPGSQVSGTAQHVTASATGWVNTAINPPVTIAAGTYWIGIWSNDSGGAAVNTGYTTGVAFWVISQSTFPTTFPAGATNDNSFFGPMAIVLDYCP